MTSSMIQKVNTFIEEHALFESVRSAIIGVSGGADSMCLLDLLHKRGDISLTVVHVNHGIRGDEALRDADFVERACVERDIPFVLISVDVPQIAQEQGRGLEEVGRQVRYEAFRRVQDQVGADCIMTAHTASDQVETVLHNIVRGCGLSGLGGMTPSDGRLIRPLLACTRTEIEQYCADNGIAFVTDSTNEDETYTRNILRRRVLPMLREINPSVDAAILRLAQAAESDETMLTDYARQKMIESTVGDGEYDREVLLSLPKSIRYRFLRVALEQLDCRSMEHRHFALFDEMLSAGSGCVQLPGGFQLCVSDGCVSVGTQQTSDDAPVALRDLMVEELPFCAEYGGYTLRMSIEDRESIDNLKKVHKMFFKYTVDYDKINSGLYWRTRDAGDYMHPAGRHVGKSLKTLMSEWHLSDRVGYPLLCDADGIVMVPGYCCDERVRTDEDTNHFLVCTVEKVSI